MSNARFRGLGHVFSFTLGQMVKSRANIVSAVILLVMALVSVPLIQLTNGHGSVGPDVPAIVEQAIAASTQRKTAARLGGPRRFFGEVFCGCSIADTFSAFTALVNRG